MDKNLQNRCSQIGSRISRFPALKPEDGRTLASYRGASQLVVCITIKIDFFHKYLKSGYILFHVRLCDCPTLSFVFNMDIVILEYNYFRKCCSKKSEDKIKTLKGIIIWY